MRIYVETSVVSFLTARATRDVIIAGRQRVTKLWWEYAKERHELVVSQLVVDEATEGDRDAAVRRLEVLEHLPRLDFGSEAVAVARHLVKSGAIPVVAAADAMHIGIAATNSVKYLVTWNFKHLVNATVRSRIEAECRRMGFEPSIICTPDELYEA